MRRMVHSIVLIGSCTAALAQTNYITFTNKEGVVITGAEVIRVEANKLTYRLREGAGGGVVKFMDLPESIRARFGYDEVHGVQAEKAERERLARAHAAEARALAERRRVQQLAQRLAETAKVVDGMIIQKVADGLLVNCGDEVSNRIKMTPQQYSGLWRRRALTGQVLSTPYTVTYDPGAGLPQLASGLIFLQDYPEGYKGQHVTTIAYLLGEYSYTTVQHASSTIPRFSADLASAAQRLLLAAEREAELKIMGAARFINGRVREKLPGGLIVESGDGIKLMRETAKAADQMPYASTNASPIPLGVTEIEGLVFLQDYRSQIENGQGLFEIGYPMGEIRYGSGAAERMIPRFSTDSAIAARFALQNSAR